MPSGPLICSRAVYSAALTAPLVSSLWLRLHMDSFFLPLWPLSGPWDSKPPELATVPSSVLALHTFTQPKGPFQRTNQAQSLLSTFNGLRRNLPLPVVVRSPPDLGCPRPASSSSLIILSSLPPPCCPPWLSGVRDLHPGSPMSRTAVASILPSPDSAIFEALPIWLWHSRHLSMLWCVAGFSPSEFQSWHRVSLFLMVNGEIHANRTSNAWLLSLPSISTYISNTQWGVRKCLQEPQIIQQWRLAHSAASYCECGTDTAA